MSQVKDQSLSVIESICSDNHSDSPVPSPAKSESYGSEEESYTESSIESYYTGYEPCEESRKIMKSKIKK